MPLNAPTTSTAILFDLDGTLLNTLDDLAESANEVLRHRGYREHPVDAYRYFVGEGVDILGQRVLPEGARDDEAVREFVVEMRRIYGARQTLKTRPYDGVEEMLDGFGVRGLAMTVLSNKPDDAVKELIAHFFPGHRFAVVRGALPGVPKKPDPTAALAVARDAAIPAAQFIYLGDTATDMQTASAAGMFAIGALWGFRDAAELQASGARALVKRPQDVLAFA